MQVNVHEKRNGFGEANGRRKPTSGVTVIKVGGAQLNMGSRLGDLVAYVEDAMGLGQRVIIVHGGGCEIADLHHQLGVPFEQKSGLRTTSAESIDIVTMVLAGLVNKRVVGQLQLVGIPAIGVSGIDLGLLRAECIDKDRLGYVGGVPDVNTGVLDKLLSLDAVPVVAPVSQDSNGQFLNVNADIAAQAVAVAMNAACLEFVTDVDGVKSPRGFEQRIDPDNLKRMLASKAITGGMIPKAQAAMAAVSAGVDRVRLGTYESLRNGNATEVYA